MNYQINQSYADKITCHAQSDEKNPRTTVISCMIKYYFLSTAREQYKTFPT